MPAINSATTLTVGTTAVQLTNGGNFSPGGVFPRGGLLVCPAANSGTVHIRHDGTATTDYPPVPKSDTFSAGLPFSTEMINQGISIIGSASGQTVYVYPF